jgi:hypothetical protein
LAWRFRDSAGRVACRQAGAIIGSAERLARTEAIGMSAVNTNLNDREHEALRRAQRAHEPSMEEILASIRTIIAEERDPAKASELRNAPAKSGTPPAPPQMVFSKGEPAASSGAAPLAQHAAPASEGNAPKVVWRPVESKTAEPPEPATADDTPLLSPETDTAVAAAFETLSANLAARSAELAEGLAREMLRPMLKTWLDDNLPALVERLIRAEIDRVVRGAR